MSAERERHLVELVSADGRPAGAATVAEAHTAPGRLHRAFSILLFDLDGRVLIQQRAAAKTRFPLRWANTCCGHPAPGEPVSRAAERRLAEEIGIRDQPLTELGVFIYRAGDPDTDRVEHEYDHVLVGAAPPKVEITPDPAEVAGISWAAAEPLLATVRTAGDGRYAPWLRGVLEIAIAGLPELPEI